MGGFFFDAVRFYLGSLNAPSAHPSFFNGEASLGGGVYYLQLPNGNVFGYYNYENYPPVIYSYSLGFEGVVDSGNGQNYFFDFTSGHWWYPARVCTRTCTTLP